MALFLYCGLPGCGKTTLATALAVKTARRGKYQHVYSNYPVAHPIVETIDNTWLGTRQIENAAVFVDEATLWADSRDYKSFDYARKQFILLHRHYNTDVYFFCQQFNALDVKIRRNIDRVYFLEKPRLFSSFTRIRPVPYGMYVPDGTKEKHGLFKRKEFGEIQEGYHLDRGFMQTLFSKRIYRPRWYQYFDSFDAPELPPIDRKEWEALNPTKRFEDFYPAPAGALAGEANKDPTSADVDKPNTEPAAHALTKLE